VKDNPWRYAHLGTQLAVAILLGAGAGYAADERWGSRPWGMLAGTAVGAAAGFYQFFKEVAPPKP
jgi:F0F1-type ATP synthase assembly protein I